MVRLKSRPNLRQYRIGAKRTFMKAWNEFFPTTRRSGAEALEIPNDTTLIDVAGGISVSENAEGVGVVENISTGTTIDTQVQRFRPPAHTRLPYEMLANVFSYSSEDFKINIPADLSNTFPWNCSRVCSSWKAVADSMPGLWTRIIVDFKRWSNFEGHVNLVNSILSRQPESLISLTITPGRGRYFEAYVPIEYITRHLLNAHSNRFRSLCFNKGHHFKSFLAQSPGSMKNLETLRWIVDEKVEDVVVFQDAPSLRKVFIDLGGQGPWINPTSLLNLQFPWSQLTHIHLPGSLFTPADAFALLRQSVNLKDCHLGFDAEHSTAALDSVTTVITLPALETFIVENMSFDTDSIDHPSGITDLLKLLDAPNLIDFKISGDCGGRGPSIRWDDSAFIEFIQRCSTLKRLVVNEVVPVRYMESLLRSAPALVRLSILYGQEVPTAVLRHMSDPDFLPDLETLRCCIADLDAFSDMLESRWAKPSSPLREVSITLDENSGETYYLKGRRVMALMDRGKNIMVNFQG